MLTKATHPQKMKGDLGKQNDWELSFLFFFFLSLLVWILKKNIQMCSRMAT